MNFQIFNMFFQKNLNYLLTGFCFLFFILGLLTNDPLNWFEASYQKSPLLLDNITKNDIEKIEVYTGTNLDLNFKKNDSNWFAQDSITKNDYKIDNSILDSNIDNLLAIRKYQEVASNKDKFSTYNVDTNGFHVIVTATDKKKYDIYIGKQATEFNTTSVRLSNEESIYSAKGNLKNDWSQSLNHFRDKSLFHFIPDNIASFSVSGLYNYSVVKNDKMWKINFLGQNNDTDENRINTLLKDISNLKADSFADAEVSQQKYASITLKTLSAEDLVLDIYTSVNNKEVYFVKTSYLQDITSISKWRIDSILVKPLDLKKSTIANTPGK